MSVFEGLNPLGDCYFITCSSVLLQDAAAHKGKEKEKGKSPVVRILWMFIHVYVLTDEI